MPIYKLADCRHGRFLYNPRDQYVGFCLQTYGEWSELEVGLFQQIIRPGDVVVEAGANIGSHTVCLSRATGDSGNVLAFEPARHTFQLLCANLALNDCINVHVRQQAIGNEIGMTQFPLFDPRVEQNFGAASLLDVARGAPAEAVEIRTIDSLGLPRLDFLKTDVEGYEPALLDGARETLRRCRPIVYVEIDTRCGGPVGNRDELLSRFEPLGYEAYYVITPMYNPKNFRSAPAMAPVLNAWSLDMLAVPRERVGVEGLTRARIGDGVFAATDGSVRFAVTPATGARISYF